MHPNVVKENFGEIWLKPSVLTPKMLAANYCFHLFVFDTADISVTFLKIQKCHT